MEKCESERDREVVCVCVCVCVCVRVCDGGGPPFCRHHLAPWAMCVSVLSKSVRESKRREKKRRKR